MKPKIIVVGSSNTDMVVKVPHIPAPGETLLGSDFMIIPGGKGANQAVAAARTGADVTFITCVSDDTFGKQAIENYKKDGIDTSFIKVQPGTHSGIALINVAADGENSISVAPGANSFLYEADIFSRGAAFDEARIVIAQLEVPMEAIEAAAELATAKGIPFILNPAPGTKIPDRLFKNIAFLTPNESEAVILTSDKKFSEDEIVPIADELFSRGVRTVIITLGKKGVYVKTAGLTRFIPGYKVRATDTTAAGDVFNGSLASSLASGVKLDDAIDFAQKAAAISVTRTGAQPSAPFIDEVMKFKF